MRLAQNDKKGEPELALRNDGYCGRRVRMDFSRASRLASPALLAQNDRVRYVERRLQMGSWLEIATSAALLQQRKDGEGVTLWGASARLRWLMKDNCC